MSLVVFTGVFAPVVILPAVGAAVMATPIKKYTAAIALQESKAKILINGIHCVGNICDTITEIATAIENAKNALESFKSKQNYSESEIN